MLKKLLIGGILGACALTGLSPVARADGDRDTRDRDYRPAPYYGDRDDYRPNRDRDRDYRDRDDARDRDYRRDRDRDTRDRDDYRRNDYRRNDYNRGGNYGYSGGITVYGGGTNRPRYDDRYDRRPRYDDRYDRRRRYDDRPRYDSQGRIITGAIVGGILGAIIAR